MRAIAEAKQNSGNLEKRTKTEEKIAQNGINNNLENLITKTLNKLKKGKLTKKEKEQLANELLSLIAAEISIKKMLTKN